MDLSGGHLPLNGFRFATADVCGSSFRFHADQRVRVLNHPSKPVETVVGRWRGEEFRDPYGENLYEVTGFLVKQRESFLEPAPQESEGA